jgi:hypothetical protein
MVKVKNIAGGVAHRIQIRWIRLFFGLLDPDPDPSIINQNLLEKH